MTDKTFFRDAWTEQKDYVDWLTRDKDSTRAYCLACKKSFSLGNMGICAVRSHAEKSKKHRENLANLLKRKTSTMPISQFLTKKTSQGNPASSCPATHERPGLGTVAYTTSSSIASQVQLDNSVLRAEIIWSLKLVSSNFSYNSCAGLPDTFKTMFKDSPTAQAFALSDRKASYVVQYGLAPYFKNSLIEQMRKVGDFVFLFDESLNKITNRKQMHIHARYWVPEQEQVMTRYLTSVFMGHGAAKDIIEHFDEGLSNLKGILHNLLQLSMDGPNVNWKFHREFSKNLERDCQSKIIDIGSCGLHIVHGAFKDGALKFDTNEILSSLHWLFKDSPARRQDFMQVTGTDDFPLKFCQHRWVENLPVVARALQMWHCVLVYVESVEQKKVPHPGNKSYETIKHALKDPLTEAKMSFFKRIAKVVNPFLTKYQCEKPMVPFLCGDMKDMMLELMGIFIKSEELQKVKKSARKVLSFDVQNRDLQVTYKQVDVGIETEMYLKKVAGKVSEARVMDFKMKCKDFAQTVVKKLLDKAPVKYALVRNLRCMDPKRMGLEADQCIRDMKETLKHLMEVNKVDLEQCDITMAQYKNMLRNTNFDKFDCDKDRLDIFLRDLIGGNKDYGKLWSLLKKMMILSHGQASVERGFSFNKAVERQNLSESSFIAQRTVKDSIVVAGGPLNVPITAKMLVSVASSHSRYMEDLKQQKKEKETQERNLKRRHIVEEIEELKKKKARTDRDMTAMLQKADNLCEQAEKNRKITLVAQANSLRKTAKEKSQQLDDIDKELDLKLAELKGH